MPRITHLTQMVVPQRYPEITLFFLFSTQNARFRPDLPRSLRFRAARHHKRGRLPALLEVPTMSGIRLFNSKVPPRRLATIFRRRLVIPGAHMGLSKRITQYTRFGMFVSTVRPQHTHAQHTHAQHTHAQHTHAQARGLHRVESSCSSSEY